jgi:hypothetical protein
LIDFVSERTIFGPIRLSFEVMGLAVPVLVLDETCNKKIKDNVTVLPTPEQFKKAQAVILAAYTSLMENFVNNVN